MKWYYNNGAVTKPHATLFGHRRRTILLVLGAVGLCLLALILGLAIGLTRNRSA